MISTSHDRQFVPPGTLPPPPAPIDASRHSLFLDFDGTLVNIAHHPDAIEVAPDLPELLATLSRSLDGRLAIISGRALADLDRHLGAAGLAMAGSHGGEFREMASGAAISLAEPLPIWVEAELREFAARLDGLLIEPKPFSIAIHYRSDPDAEPEVIAVADSLAEIAGLTIKRGKMVVELLMPGPDKGGAVARFMEAPPFAGTHPIFLGDDITDEDAFRAVKQFGGGGVLVGPQRETSAQWRLADVDTVHEWLQAALV